MNKKSINASKAVSILKKMDKEEWKILVKWLTSPWCNSTKKLVDLLAALEDFRSDFEDPKLTREKIFQKIYKEKEYNVRVLDNLFWELNRAIEDFISFNAFAQSENTKKYFLASALQEKGLENRFKKVNISTTENLESKPVKTWEEQNLLFQLKRQLYHHPNEKWRMDPKSTLLPEMDQNLELTYLLQKAANINEKKARTRILKDTHFDVKKEIQIWLQLAENIDLPAINLYRKRFQYTEENRLNQYFDLREEFISNFEKLNKWDQQIHFVSFINDSTHLRKKGLVDLSDTLPLFKLGLSSGILIEKDRIKPSLFITIVSASNLKRDFEFTKHFAENYAKYLPEDAIEDGKFYAIAHIANRTKKLTECIKTLNQNNFKNNTFRLSTKLLELQNYFDLLLDDDNYITTFDSRCGSVEQWFRRGKILSESNRKPFVNFVQKCRTLMRLYREPDFNEDAVRSVLEGELNVQPINWLFEKRDEIIRRRKNGKSLVSK